MSRTIHFLQHLRGFGRPAGRSISGGDAAARAAVRAGRPDRSLIGVMALGGLLAAATLAEPGRAAPEARGAFGDWRVYVDRTERGQVCFAASRAAETRPATGGPSGATFTVGSWRGSGPKEQPTFHGGVDLRDGSGTRATVGGRSYRMFVDGDEAFAISADDDRRLVAAMRAGSTMTVRTVTEDGTRASVRFSLDGVTRALREVAALCG